MPSKAERLLDQASAAFAARRFDETIALCQRALASNSDNSQAHKLWAYASLPGDNYVAVLERIHRHLRPRTYVEIGVHTGTSFALAQPGTRAVGIDPQPQLRHPVVPPSRVFSKTSDAFFAEHDLSAELGQQPVDLAFLDGMHEFSFTLRDFINIERYCGPASTILVHDCFPLDARTASPYRSTAFWSGDVWKLIPCLKKWRPELSIHTIATAPTGLAVIRGLDPDSTVLRDRLQPICEEFSALPYASLQDDKKGTLNLVQNEWARLQALLPSPLMVSPP
jgi:hypothetical protein